MMVTEQSWTYLKIKQTKNTHFLSVALPKHNFFCFFMLSSSSSIIVVIIIIIAVLTIIFIIIIISVIVVIIIIAMIIAISITSLINVIVITIIMIIKIIEQLQWVPRIFVIFHTYGSIKSFWFELLSCYYVLSIWNFYRKFQKLV